MEKTQKKLIGWVLHVIYHRGSRPPRQKVQTSPFIPFHWGTRLGLSNYTSSFTTRNREKLLNWVISIWPMMAQTLQKSEGQVNFYFFNRYQYFSPISLMEKISFSGPWLMVGELLFWGSLGLNWYIITTGDWT